MIEVLLGWISSVKSVIIYILAYVTVLLVLQVIAIRAYFRKFDSQNDDDLPPSANYMP
jgi:hypothetical protein